MPALKTIVCSFVTRGSPVVGPPGPQGHELLWYTPIHLRETPGATEDDLEYVLVEQVEPGKDEEKGKDLALLAAHKSIKTHLLLDAKQDLKLVRRSRTLPWGDGCNIISFCFRTTELYERGVEYEWERAAAAEEGEEFGPPEGVEWEAFELDNAMYRVVESKLGVHHHTWTSLEYFDEHPEAMPIEFISTAFHLVLLPPKLDQALLTFASVKGSIPPDVAEQALNQMHKVVSTRHARKAFRFWSPAVPPPGPKSKIIPAGVVKYRLYCYWLDVVAYHLRSCNPLLETIISATFLRTLQSIEPLVNDPKISVDDFEKSTLKGISAELARSRYARGVLQKLSLGKILERPLPKIPINLKKREHLHIITLGHSPLVFGVLRELIHYLLTVSAHPYSSLHPGINALTKLQEIEYLNRPESLKITVCETRPSCAGVVLAERLHSVIEKSGDRAKELRQMSRPGGPAGLSQGIRERMRGEWGGSEGIGSEGGSEAGDEGEGAWSLEALVKAVDAPNPSSKVLIEVIPDGGIVAAVRMSPPGSVIVLIPAERVLPGESDVVAPTGSFMLAWCGKEIKAKVYAIAAVDLIVASHKSKMPDLPQGDPSEMTAGWKDCFAPSASLGAETVEAFAGKVASKKVHTVEVRHQPSEAVPHHLIEAWITDSGVLSGAGCAALGRERGAAEKAIYGDEAG